MEPTKGILIAGGAGPGVAHLRGAIQNLLAVCDPVTAIDIARLRVAKI